MTSKIEAVRQTHDQPIKASMPLTDGLQGRDVVSLDDLQAVEQELVKENKLTKEAQMKTIMLGVALVILAIACGVGLGIGLTLASPAVELGLIIAIPFAAAASLPLVILFKSSISDNLSTHSVNQQFLRKNLAPLKDEGFKKFAREELQLTKFSIVGLPFAYEWYEWHKKLPLLKDTMQREIADFKESLGKKVKAEQISIDDPKTAELLKSKTKQEIKKMSVKYNLWFTAMMVAMAAGLVMIVLGGFHTPLGIALFTAGATLVLGGAGAFFGGLIKQKQHESQCNLFKQRQEQLEQNPKAFISFVKEKVDPNRTHYTLNQIMQLHKLYYKQLDLEKDIEKLNSYKTGFQLYCSPTTKQEGQ